MPLITQLNQKQKDQILKEIHHGKITTLKQIKDENFMDIHWNSIYYKSTGESILHIAARLGFINIINYLFENFQPISIDITNKDDKTPLHEATQFNQFDCVLLLCDNGANVNALRRGDWTPIMLACTKVCLSNNLSVNIVKELIRYGANINIANKDGWTCLHILARNGSVEILEILLENNIKINCCTKNGRTALHISAFHGHLEFVAKLLSFIDINVKDNCGNTPLHEAILGNHLNLVKFLIEKGANIHEENNNGFSLIHLATTVEEAKDLLEYLLTELKFNINCQTRNGWTPLHCAARKQLRETYKYLITHNANLILKDNYNRIPDDYLKTI